MAIWSDLAAREARKENLLWGSHFSLLKSHYVCVLSRFSHVQLFVAPRIVDYSASLSMGILQARIGSHSFLQRIFPAQGLKVRLLCLLHCRQILYH